MHPKAFVALLLIHGCVGRLIAQPTRSDPVDVQGRVGIDLNLNLPRKWEASLGYEARMMHDASTYQGSYFEGELGRAVRKNLTLFTDYRLALVPDAVSHRVGVGAEWERKMRRYSLAFRPLYQYQRTVLDDADQGSRQALRTRLKAKVPANKRLTIHGSVEPYFGFTGIYPVDNWRNTLGAQWQFTKKRKIDLYYIYRPDYAKEFYNRTYHIFGVTVSNDMKFPR